MSDKARRSTEDQAADGPEFSADRRKVLSRLTVGLAALAGGGLTVPIVGVLLSPAREQRDLGWAPVGRLEQFPVGATVKVRYLDPRPLPWAGFAARNAAWVRRVSEADLVAYSIYCTHVGCPVRWEEGAELFMCPCHGGAFYSDGAVAAGPPPRPLDRFEVRVVDGQVEVLTHPIPLPS